WRKIITDVLNMEVEYLASSIGAPYGDALLAGVGTKNIKGYEVIREWLSSSEINKPDSEASLKYEKLYRIYKRLYQSLEEEFKELKATET
ncbi:MAG: carbohydrate kinase, partial [Thermoproteota archaeon]